MLPTKTGIDVRDDVKCRHDEDVQKRLTEITTSGSCNWNLTADGFNGSMYPRFATQYLRRMRDFQFDDYDMAEEGRAARPASVVGVSSSV